MENSKYELWIDGQKVPVSEEIYQAYKSGERKEGCFMKALKNRAVQGEYGSPDCNGHSQPGRF